MAKQHARELDTMVSRSLYRTIELTATSTTPPTTSPHYPPTLPPLPPSRTSVGVGVGAMAMEEAAAEVAREARARHEAHGALARGRVVVVRALVHVAVAVDVLATTVPDSIVQLALVAVAVRVLYRYRLVPCVPCVSAGSSARYDAAHVPSTSIAPG